MINIIIIVVSYKKERIEGIMRLKIVIGLALVMAFIACTSSKTKETQEDYSKGDANIPETWPEQMKFLEKSLVELYPLILSPSDFGKKENQNKILFHLERLSAVSKKVNHSPMSQMNDPSLAYISFDFKEQIDLSKNSFESGNKDFARFELLKTTNFCIECHTQTNKGPSFNSDLFKQNFSNLNILDQAEIYTATRKFDEALKKYKEFFELKEVSWDYQFRAESALHNSLSILVRFKRDSKATKEFLIQTEKSKFIPLYLKTMIQVWKDDTHTWSLAKDKKPSLTTIKVWIERANSRRFDYGSLGGEIWNQLAISYLHEMLDGQLDVKKKSEVFWYLGSSYINSLTHYQTSLGEKYLEGCIKNTPHTAQSKKCYGKMEEYMYDMYSGSAGTFMPLTEEIKLKELKKMAY